MVHQILVSSYADEIYTLAFDTEALTPSLKCTSAIKVGFQPSWITSHPQDPFLVYTCLEQEEGKVVLVKYERDGTASVLADASSGGTYPCSILASNHELLIANYMSGSISAVQILGRPPYFSGAPITTRLTGSGPNCERQSSSHAHQVVLLHDGRELLVPNLGADRVHIFRKSQSGSWTLQGHIQYPPGSGPRHIAFYDGYLYTLLELTNQLARSPYPSSTEQPLLTIKPTLSKAPVTPNDMLAAEVLIPKPNSCYPTPYIYVSNRNDPSPDGDTIAIFSTDMNLVAEVRTGLNHVRGMMFGGPADRWLVVGGVNGGGVKVFERIDGGKGLREIVSNSSIEKPTGFLWLGQV